MKIDIYLGGWHSGFCLWSYFQWNAWAESYVKYATDVRPLH